MHQDCFSELNVLVILLSSMKQNGSFTRTAEYLFYYSIIIKYIQQDATLHSLSGNCCTCFGWYFYPSPGAHATVCTASGICHTVTAIWRYNGDFNFVPSYSMVETSYNMMFGMTDLLVMSIFGSDLPYSFCDLFTLLLKVSYFICGAFRWLIGL
jgi:hypothetical protein